ncbi:MAG: HAD-IC family P-type ATPase, partial [Pseudomonadota bacterium]
EDKLRKAETDLIYRLAVAGFAAANVMLLSVSVWSGAAQGDMGEGLKTLFHWLTALIALPAVAYAGQPFFRSALDALQSWRINMDVPISLGVILATAMSVFQTINGDGHVYFDAAVMLLFFLLIGRVLDTRMRSRAAGAASNLVALQATAATVVAEDGSLQRKSAYALDQGALLHIAPGERIAADGCIELGRSDLDNSLITGESTPQACAPGDEVFAGAINLSGPIQVRATAVGESTVLSEIGRLMTAAEQSRGRFVRLADRAANIYAPAVHVLSLATFLAWIALGAHWIAALTAAIAVLIITCPCALALAVPAVQVAASSRLFA